MIRLRPHHGMCLAYFEGKGYSDGFTGNMQHMLELLEKGADVEMAVFGDEICKACPNLKHGVCSVSYTHLLRDSLSQKGETDET